MKTILLRAWNNFRNSTPYGTLPRGDVGRGVRLPLLYPPNPHGNQNGNMNGSMGNRGGGPGTPGTPGNWGVDGDDDRYSQYEDEARNDHKYVLQAWRMIHASFIYLWIPSLILIYADSQSLEDHREVDDVTFWGTDVRSKDCAETFRYCEMKRFSFFFHIASILIFFCLFVP